jgi:hypothetical protein
MVIIYNRTLSKDEILEVEAWVDGMYSVSNTCSDILLLTFTAASQDMHAMQPGCPRH